MRRPATCLSSLVGVLVVASALRAAEARDPVAAEALFREGREASERGEHALACLKFKESQRLDPALGTLFNIADCEEKQGKVATAWSLFEEVTQRLPPGDERQSIARARAAALVGRLPRLTVRLAKGPPGTRVRRDGVELGAASLGTALPVDPGEHRLRVDAPGHAPSEVLVRIAEGEQREVEVTPGPAQQALPPGTDRPPEQQPGGAPTLGWVLLSLGGAGLVTGGVAGFLVLDRKATADDHCPGRACDATGYDAVRSGRTLSTVSTVGFAVGGIAAAAGLWLVLDAPRAAAPKGREAAAGRTWVGAAMAPGVVSVGVASRF